MARNWNGTSDFLDVVDSPSVNMGNSDFGISVWIRSATTPAANNRLFNKGTGTGGSKSNPGVRYELHITTAGTQLSFVIDNLTLKKNVVWTFGTDLFDGTWHHLFFRHRDNDATNGLRIYLDGIQKAADSSTGVGSIDNGFTLVVGAGRGASDTVESFWPGDIAEFAIWNVLLFDAEIKALASGVPADQISPIGRPNQSTPKNTPVVYLPMIPKGSLFNERDVTRFGNHAIATGTTWATHPPMDSFELRAKTFGNRNLEIDIFTEPVIPPVVDDVTRQLAYEGFG